MRAVRLVVATLVAAIAMILLGLPTRGFWSWVIAVAIAVAVMTLTDSGARWPWKGRKG